MDKFNYALGLNIGQSLRQSGVTQTDIIMDDFKDGLLTAIYGKESRMTQQEVAETLNREFTRLMEKMNQKAIDSGKRFLEENAKKEGVQVTKSGLQYKVVKGEGSGKHPGPHSRVKCHYEGSLVDGTVFDSSFKRGEPATFGLDQVIQGWTEGLQLMSEGEEFDFYIPYNLGYGEKGHPGVIPGYSVLVFKVKLLEVLK